MKSHTDRLKRDLIKQINDPRLENKKLINQIEGHAKLSAEVAALQDQFKKRERALNAITSLLSELETQAVALNIALKTGRFQFSLQDLLKEPSISLFAYLHQEKSCRETITRQNTAQIALGNDSDLSNCTLLELDTIYQQTFLENKNLSKKQPDYRKTVDMIHRDVPGLTGKILTQERALRGIISKASLQKSEIVYLQYNLAKKHQLNLARWASMFPPARTRSDSSDDENENGYYSQFS